mmetsp:Transcript_129426/g.224708  ORF Transcript_129426/g.224708 Transcript_129426/m.224708 type:complete len:205 (+) Transcript_129426:531-1145(+)
MTACPSEDGAPTDVDLSVSTLCTSRLQLGSIPISGIPLHMTACAEAAGSPLDLNLPSPPDKMCNRGRPAAVLNLATRRCALCPAHASPEAAASSALKESSSNASPSRCEAMHCSRAKSLSARKRMPAARRCIRLFFLSAASKPDGLETASQARLEEEDETPFRSSCATLLTTSAHCSAELTWLKGPSPMLAFTVGAKAHCSVQL